VLDALLATTRGTLNRKSIEEMMGCRSKRGNHRFNNEMQWEDTSGWHGHILFLVRI
jgi:hypothetical protein